MERETKCGEKCGIGLFFSVVVECGIGESGVWNRRLPNLAILDPAPCHDYAMYVRVYMCRSYVRHDRLPLDYDVIIVNEQPHAHSMHTCMHAHVSTRYDGYVCFV